MVNVGKNWKWLLLNWLLIGIIACNNQASNKVSQPADIAEKEVSVSNIPVINTMDQDSIVSLIKKGNRQWELNTPDSALYYYKQALWYSEQRNFHEGMARSLSGIGRYWYEVHADYGRAREYFLLSVRHCGQDKTKNDRISAFASQYIGQTYIMHSQYDSAVYWYERTISIRQRYNPADTLALMVTYEHLGIALARSLDNVALNFDRALYYLSKAKASISQQHKKTRQLANIHSNIGALFHEKGMHDSALYYYQLALQGYTESGHCKYKQATYSNIARIYITKNEFDHSKQYLDSAIAANPEDASNVLVLQQNIAVHYRHSGQLEKAIDLYKLILKRARLEKNTHIQLRGYPELITLLDSVKNIPQAYYYLRKYLNVVQQNNDEKALYAINQTEVKFRTAQKDKELAQKQYLIARQQLKIQQQYLWIGGALTGLILLGTILYRRQQKTKIARLEARLEGEEQERMRLATELHDGIVSRLSYAKMNFDALAPAGTAAHIDAAGFQEAVHYLEQSIAELRATSHNMLPSALENMGLETALDIYCQKITKVLPLAIDFCVEGDLPLLTEAFELHIYRIVQELLNNIIKHAEASAVALVCTADNKHLRISVQDNGKGMPAENLQAGVGLYNLQNRLKILGGKMQVNSGAQGTQILLDFDLKHYILART